MGMGESDREGLSMVEAEVPMSEMFKYAVDLRSMSQGRGEFTFEFTRYDQAPANIAEKVIAASQNKGWKLLFNTEKGTVNIFDNSSILRENSDFYSFFEYVWSI